MVKAGLWEKEVRLLPFGKVNYEVIMRLAEEQSVVGLVTLGLEHVADVKVSQVELLQFIGSTLQLEQRNKDMNVFLAGLTERFKREKVHGLLVKGQGVAQCYKKPLWRASGDVDLLLDSENYERAKAVLFPIAERVDREDTVAKHQALSIKGFEVELHGRMPFFLSRRVDDVIDDVLADSLKKDGDRIWRLGETDVYLPRPDNDVIIVFQICDWCRLLWTYRESLNHELLVTRIRKMGLMIEWKAFASLAVNTLGMPKEAMPLYSKGFDKRADKILRHILKCGNLGHNNDLSYRAKYGGLVSGMITFYRRVCDFVKFTFIFPVNAPRFFVTYVFSKVKYYFFA